MTISFELLSCHCLCQDCQDLKYRVMASCRWATNQHVSKPQSQYGYSSWDWEALFETFPLQLQPHFFDRNKFVEFDMKPVCKKCYEKFPLELKKRLKKLSEAVARKWTHNRAAGEGKKYVKVALDLTFMELTIRQHTICEAYAISIFSLSRSFQNKQMGWLHGAWSWLIQSVSGVPINLCLSSLPFDSNTALYINHMLFLFLHIHQT